MKVIIPVPYILTVSLFCCSTAVFSERYLVTEDEFGGYSAKSLEQEKKVVLNKSESSLPESTKVQTKLRPEEKLLQPQSQKSSTILEGAESIDKVKITTKKPLSIFEQKYIESENKARKEAIQRLEKNAGARPFDATEIDESEYVDGDALLRQSLDQPVSKVPYFTSVDTEGNITNTPYDPLLEKDAWEKLREKQIVFTEAKIYEGSTINEQKGEIILPEGADPVALQIISSGENSVDSYFKRFSRECCTNLPYTKVSELVLDRSLSLSLDKKDLAYRFTEGDSRYLLLKFPDEIENFPFLIRTFIRSYSKKGIEHGVFFPQLITLDVDKKPLRIITGPLLKYVAETWTTYGYLEGVFEIIRDKDHEEKYILINTTKEVLSQSSTIEGDKKPIQLTHMATGLFEFKLPREE